MDHMKSSAQDEPILKDQLLPPPYYSQLEEKKRKKKKEGGISELQIPLLLIRAEFQKACGRTRPEKVFTIKEAMDTKYMLLIKNLKLYHNDFK